MMHHVILLSMLWPFLLTGGFGVWVVCVGGGYCTHSPQKPRSPPLMFLFVFFLQTIKLMLP